MQIGTKRILRVIKNSDRPSIVIIKLPQLSVEEYISQLILLNNWKPLDLLKIKRNRVLDNKMSNDHDKPTKFNLLLSNLEIWIKWIIGNKETNIKYFIYMREEVNR